MITTVDVAKSNANDNLKFNSDFAISTGTLMDPITMFVFDGKIYTGRIVMPNNGPKIVVYDLTTLTVDAGTTLTVRGALPIGLGS